MNPTSTTTVAVFGATGQQGGSVVEALLSRGANFRALVRNPESDRARALADRGVALATIDLDDPATLAAGLEEVDAFFFMTTPGRMTTPDSRVQVDVEGEARQGIALVDAAVAAGVPHVVFSSVGGAERDSGIPHFTSKRRVEEHLLASPLRSTITRPVAFMDNFSFMGPSVEDGRLVLRWPLPDGIPLQLVAVRDLGEVNAALLLGDAEASGGAIEVAGDELTGSQLAAAFGEHAGMPSRYEALPLSVLGDDDSQAMFRWFAETPGYQADIEAVRAIDPTLWNLPTWLRATGWTPQPAA